jgi:hypothetical protein
MPEYVNPMNQYYPEGREPCQVCSRYRVSGSGEDVCDCPTCPTCQVTATDECYRRHHVAYRPDSIWSFCRTLVIAHSQTHSLGHMNLTAASRMNKRDMGVRRLSEVAEAFDTQRSMILFVQLGDGTRVYPGVSDYREWLDAHPWVRLRRVGVEAQEIDEYSDHGFDDWRFSETASTGYVAEGTEEPRVNPRTPRRMQFPNMLVNWQALHEMLHECAVQRQEYRENHVTSEDQDRFSEAQDRDTRHGTGYVPDEEDSSQV